VNRRIEPDIIPPVWDRGEWEVLVIMDACRVDLLESVITEYDSLPNDVSSVWSQAACSIDWIEKTFNGYPDECQNVAYVTANPFAHHDASHAQSADLQDHPTLTCLRELYKTEWAEIDAEGDGGSGTIETVPPERVTDHAIECWRNRERYGVDRMVVHYMQPHEPYITRPGWSQLDEEDDQAVLKNLVEEGFQAGTSPWKAMLEEGPVTVDEFWAVYQDNLRWVLDDVTERLLQNLDAETVLSADHGNGLGEYGEWHHPPGAVSPYVRKVPWVKVAGIDMREVNPVVKTDSGETDREKQLRALGYK